MLDFELDYLDDISIEHHIDGMDGNVQTEQVETSSAVNRGEIRHDKFNNKDNEGYDSDVTSVGQDEMDSGLVLSIGEAVIE